MRLLDTVTYYKGEGKGVKVSLRLRPPLFLIFVGKQGLWQCSSAVEEHHLHLRRWNVISDPGSVLLRT
jgi:hypothetical protein